MTNQAPQHGQTIIFDLVPPGGWLSSGTTYKVDRPQGAREFRFVNTETGSSGYAKPWQVAQSEWQVVA